jgi:hypothetical protein
MAHMLAVLAGLACICIGAVVVSRARTSLRMTLAAAGVKEAEADARVALVGVGLATMRSVLPLYATGALWVAFVAVFGVSLFSGGPPNAGDGLVWPLLATLVLSEAICVAWAWEGVALAQELSALATEVAEEPVAAERDEAAPAADVATVLPIANTFREPVASVGRVNGTDQTRAAQRSVLVALLAGHGVELAEAASSATTHSRQIGLNKVEAGAGVGRGSSLPRPIGGLGSGLPSGQKLGATTEQIAMSQSADNVSTTPPAHQAPATGGPTTPVRPQVVPAPSPGVPASPDSLLATPPAGPAQQVPATSAPTTPAASASGV